MFQPKADELAYREENVANIAETEREREDGKKAARWEMSCTASCTGVSAVSVTKKQKTLQSKVILLHNEILKWQR